MNKSDKLGRWKQLYASVISRRHAPQNRASQCFGAMGKKGCPCCDAEHELRAEIGSMISEIERLQNVLETQAKRRHKL